MRYGIVGFRMQSTNDMSDDYAENSKSNWQNDLYVTPGSSGCQIDTPSNSIEELPRRRPSLIANSRDAERLVESRLCANL